MANLEWREVPDGYESDIYRIFRLGDDPRLNWRLSVVTDPEPGWERATFVTVSSHRTLRAAKASARHQEVMRLHRARINRHVVTGVAATIAMVAAFSIAGPAGASLAWSVVMMVALGVALQSFVIAIDLKLGDGWGRLYREPERTTVPDRVVARVADRLRFSFAANDVQAPAAVRVISPEESWAIERRSESEQQHRR